MLRKLAGFGVVAAGVLAFAMPAGAAPALKDHYGTIGGTVRGHVHVHSGSNGYLVDVGAQARKAGDYDVTLYVEYRVKNKVLDKTTVDVCTLSFATDKSGDDCSANVGHLLGNGVWGTKMTITVRSEATGRVVGRGNVNLKG
jgi:hypothetical protein